MHRNLEASTPPEKSQRNRDFTQDHLKNSDDALQQLQYQVSKESNAISSIVRTAI